MKWLQNGYRYPVGLPASWMLSIIQSWKLCTLEEWNSLYQGEVPVFPSTTRWKRTNHNRTKKQSTSNITKFKFLHNTVHINNFFSNSVLFFLLMWRSLIRRQVSASWKPLRENIYIQIQKEKNPCCQMNRYIPWQFNLAVRKIIWEVGSLYSIICSLWFKELATFTSHLTTPSLRLICPHQIPT